MKYINEICNGCGRKITEDDNIVVCPECGTPQHRECWKKENKCVNEHLHTENFEWKPKHADPVTAENTAKTKMRPCPFCGHENPYDAKECENCSQPFEMFGRSIFPKENDEEKPHTDTGYAYKPPFEIDYEEPKNDGNSYSPERNEMPERKAFALNSGTYDPTVLGVETKSFAGYVRTSIPSYYKKFKRFENGKKVSFNFAAFFFCPFWFFFRKLYKAGIVFLTLSLALSIAFYTPLNEAYDTFTEISQFITESSGEDGTITEGNYNIINQKIEKFAKENMSTIYLFFGGELLINLAAAFTADILYKKKFLGDIKEIDEESQGINEKRYALTLGKGGVSFLAPVLAYVVMQLLSSLLVQVFF